MQEAPSGDDWGGQDEGAAGMDLGDSGQAGQQKQGGGKRSRRPYVNTLGERPRLMRWVMAAGCVG